jgi:hypothetical protein
MPFCTSRQRYHELKENLEAVAQDPAIKLVILSRGDVTPIVEALDFMGFTIALAGGVSCDNGDLVLSALSDISDCCSTCTPTTHSAQCAENEADCRKPGKQLCDSSHECCVATSTMDTDTPAIVSTSTTMPACVLPATGIVAIAGVLLWKIVA